MTTTMISALQPARCIEHEFNSLPRSLQHALQASWLDWLQGNIDDAELEIAMLYAIQRARSVAVLKRMRTRRKSIANVN